MQELRQPMAGRGFSDDDGPHAAVSRVVAHALLSILDKARSAPLDNEQDWKLVFNKKNLRKYGLSDDDFADINRMMVLVAFNGADIEVLSKSREESDEVRFSRLFNRLSELAAEKLKMPSAVRAMLAWHEVYRKTRELSDLTLHNARRLSERARTQSRPRRFEQ